jgi:hypothetical protein
VHYLVNSSLGAMKHCQLAHSANMAWALAQKRRDWGMTVEILDAQTGRLLFPQDLEAILVRRIRI